LSVCAVRGLVGWPRSSRVGGVVTAAGDPSGREAPVSEVR
jgi:hypothetical protein